MTDVLASGYREAALTEEITDSLPEFILPYSARGLEVEGDGNCGYRTVAVLLGRSEDEWPTIRRELLEEVTENQDLYVRMVGEENHEEVARMFSSLAWYEGPCGRDHWMYMPEFGHVIANRYGRPFHFFGASLTLTFLPMRIGITDATPIASAFVNGNHFVPVYLKPNAPVPPVSKNGQRYSDEKANDWQTLFEARIAVYVADAAAAKRKNPEIEFPAVTEIID